MIFENDDLGRQWLLHGPLPCPRVENRDLPILPMNWVGRTLDRQGRPGLLISLATDEAWVEVCRFSQNRLPAVWVQDVGEAKDRGEGETTEFERGRWFEKIQRKGCRLMLATWEKIELTELKEPLRM